MVVRIQQRHDTSALWKQVNPPLLAGEMGVETDGHRKMKVGDGISKWNDLPYFDEEFIHNYGDEVISGLKQFLNNTTIGDDESLDTRANLFVHGDVFVDGIVEGISRNAVCDENGNNIFDYYQKKLADVNNIVEDMTDWDTLTNEGIYKVNVSIWYIEGEFHQPSDFSSEISRQGILISRVYSDSHILQLYIPMVKYDNYTVMVPVYRTYYKADDVEVGTWSAWDTLTNSDPTVVHIAGQETIEGRKIFNGITTFSEGINVGEYGFDSLIQMNGENYIKKSTSGELYLSGSSSNIYLRPNGIESEDSQVVINTEGVIDGKCTKDAQGNVINEVYAKKEEVSVNVISTVIKDPEMTYADEDYETFANLLRKKYISALDNEEIFTFVSTPKTLYAYSADVVINEETGETETHTIYADSDVTPTALFDKYGVAYTGTEFTVAEGVISYNSVACVYKEELNEHYELSISNNVATGFSEGNYVKVKNPVNLYGDFEITVDFITPEVMETEEVITGVDEETGENIVLQQYSKGYTIFAGEENQFLSIYIEKNGYIDYNIGNGSEWILNDTNKYGSTFIEPNKRYIIKYTRAGNNFVVYISSNGGANFEVDLAFESEARITIPAFIPVLGISRSFKNPLFNGSINLDALSIKVNGIEQIQRFETLIDVIKEPDYTIKNDDFILYCFLCTYTDEETGNILYYRIYSSSSSNVTVLYNENGTIYNGTDFTIVDGAIMYGDKPCVYTEADNITIAPTLYITEDGIAGSFTNSSRVEKDILLTDNYEIIMPMIPTNKELIQGAYFFRNETKTDTMFNVVLKNDYITLSGFGGAVVIDDIQIPYEEGQQIYIKVSKYGNDLTISSSIDLESWDDINVDLTDYVVENIGQVIIGCGNWNYGPFEGVIDLNLFRIYENENIKYYPCLNIPYTPAPDGTKIVDYHYIQRTIDCYDFFLTSNYFILNEDGQFKLPYDSLDGYNRILKQWRKGAESYEYDTNLECIQTGQATNGTAVVLKKPYADDNYYVSVACSSKDRFGFTPSEDSIYYTKGRIYLE